VPNKTASPARPPRQGPDLLRLLEEEHRNFARLLQQMETELEAFRRGGDPDYELMRDIMLYMLQYADKVHHPREDRILERLQQRLQGRHDAHRLLQHVMHDHEQLAASASELVAMLGTIGADAVYPRDLLIGRAEAYASSLREHMRQEEARFIPLAREHLTAADWAALDREMPGGEDPLAAATVDPAQRALFRRLGPGHTARVRTAGG
jgi:hemerythrin-like domain-containing protein